MPRLERPLVARLSEVSAIVHQPLKPAILTRPPFAFGTFCSWGFCGVSGDGAVKYVSLVRVACMRVTVRGADTLGFKGDETRRENKTASLKR